MNQQGASAHMTQNITAGKKVTQNLNLQSKTMDEKLPNRYRNDDIEAILQAYLEEEKVYFAERSSETNFQHTNNDAFSGQKQFKPRYRCIKKYVKSIKQYKKERQRRHWLKFLVEHGFSQKQIARRLGVSERTVRNDWRKLRNYVKGQIRANREMLERHRILEFNQQIAGLTLTQECRFLKKRVEEKIKQRQRIDKLLYKIRRHITFTINLDDCTGGIPAIQPHYNNTRINLEKGLMIKFIVKKDGVKEKLGLFTIRTKPT